MKRQPDHVLDIIEIDGRQFPRLRGNIFAWLCVGHLTPAYRFNIWFKLDDGSDTRHVDVYNTSGRTE